MPGGTSEMRPTLELDRREPATRLRFSVVQHVYAPLILSLPISLTLTGVLLLAITVGALPVTPSHSMDTRFADALTLLPQLFVLCVSSCWLLFGIYMPFSALRPSRVAGTVK